MHTVYQLSFLVSYERFRCGYSMNSSKLLTISCCLCDFDVTIVFFFLLKINLNVFTHSPKFEISLKDYAFYKSYTKSWRETKR